MLCENFDTRLHEVLDQRERAEVDAQLQDHALTCDDCAEKLATQAVLLDGLRAAFAPVPSPDFTNRVLAAVRTPHTPTSWHTIAWSLVAIAALLLVAAVPAWWLLQTGQDNGSGGGVPGDGPSIAQDEPASAPGQVPTTNPTSLAGSEAGDATNTPDSGFQQLSDDAPQTSGQSVVTSDPSPPLDKDGGEGLFREGILSWELAANIPGVDKQRAVKLQSVWNDRVATPFKPVTSSVTGAVNVLRRTLVMDPTFRDDTEDQKPQAGVADGARIRDLA